MISDDEIDNVVKYYSHLNSYYSGQIQKNMLAPLSWKRVFEHVLGRSITMRDVKLCYNRLYAVTVAKNWILTQ